LNKPEKIKLLSILFNFLNKLWIKITKKKTACLLMHDPYQFSYLIIIYDMINVSIYLLNYKKDNVIWVRWINVRCDSLKWMK
jgi:hypothetical protein